jgi:hypothetical protein
LGGFCGVAGVVHRYQRALDVIGRYVIGCIPDMLTIPTWIHRLSKIAAAISGKNGWIESNI